MSTVTILGAGELGACMGRVVSSTAATVHLWDADSSKHPQQLDLSAIVPGSDAIFFCIPANAYESAARSIAPYMHEGVPIISFAKGLDAVRGRFLDQLLAEVLGDTTPIVLVSGPMLAEEIDDGKRTCALLAARDKTFFEKIEPLFRKSLLSVRYSPDVRGVAAAGILKNVYAILLGACDGCGLGNNARGALLTRSIDEMAECIKSLGGNLGTAYSLAGLGDLDATGSTDFSQNYTVGRELAKTGACTASSEGRASVDAIRAMVSLSTASTPCMNGVSEMLACSRAPVDILNELLLNP